MPKEQKGQCIGSKECKDQLLISKAILKKYNSRKKNVCKARIDYQKAFDSMPHNWIIQSLWLIGITNKITVFTKKTMSYWKTSVCLHTERKLTETEDIKISIGIFQGDSLSPLFFSISLIPLTQQLNKLCGNTPHGQKCPFPHSNSPSSLCSIYNSFHGAKQQLTTEASDERL